ncbi:MAG: hypothetical protein RR715_01635 [Comamonas sp.]
MTIITQDHLDQLDLAIASGELSVSYQGRNVTYQNTDALLKARSHIARLLQQQTRQRAPTFGGRSFGLASFDRN